MVEEPTCYVQVARRINLGDYESADVTIGLSKIPIGADDQYIKWMMETAENAVSVIMQAVDQKADIIREENRKQKEIERMRKEQAREERSSRRRTHE